MKHVEAGTVDLQRQLSIVDDCIRTLANAAERLQMGDVGGIMPENATHVSMFLKQMCDGLFVQRAHLEEGHLSLPVLECPQKSFN